MALHRFRMQSSTPTAVHAGFASFFVVYLGSYYFCVKRRDYQEHLIELMMKLNSFEPAVEMPEPLPINEHHPFVLPVKSSTSNSTSNSSSTTEQPNAGPPRQYVAHLPERKEWQKPLKPQDPQELFRPVGK